MTRPSRREFLRQSPAAGEAVLVRYLGRVQPDGGGPAYESYKLVVDRHSNFWFRGGRLRQWLNGWLSRYSIRRADITIVTNDELVNDFIDGLGRAFVLPGA